MGGVEPVVGLEQHPAFVLHALPSVPVNVLPHRGLFLGSKTSTGASPDSTEMVLLRAVTHWRTVEYEITA